LVQFNFFYCYVFFDDLIHIYFGLVVLLCMVFFVLFICQRKVKSEYIDINSDKPI